MNDEIAVSIHRSIQAGVLPDLQKHLEQVKDLSSTDLLVAPNRHGDSAFHVAARCGHVMLLRRLHEEHGVPLNLVNSDGKWALHEAAQNKRKDCVEYLVSAGMPIDCLKRADWTPLMLACAKDSKEVIDVLLRLGASLKLKNKDGWTPFHIACREGHPDIINSLLDADPGCWETRSNNGRSPLHTVALHGRLQAVRIIKQRCMYDVDLIDSCGVTPLMDAVRGDHVELSELLISEWTADPDCSDVLGRRAIHHGAQAGALGTVQLLLQITAQDPNTPATVTGATPLHYAAKDGQAEMISLLLEQGADPIITDHHGRTALDVAKKARQGAAAVAALSI